MLLWKVRAGAVKVILVMIDILGIKRLQRKTRGVKQRKHDRSKLKIVSRTSQFSLRINQTKRNQTSSIHHHQAVSHLNHQNHSPNTPIKSQFTNKSAQLHLFSKSLPNNTSPTSTSRQWSSKSNPKKLTPPQHFKSNSQDNYNKRRGTLNSTCSSSN